jgi:hypothetical protein
LEAKFNLLICLVKPQPVLRRTSISFSEKTQIKKVTSASNLAEDPEDLWFQADDYKKMKNSVFDLVEKVEKGETDGKRYCIRGLEGLMKAKSGERKEKIYKARDSVMHMQQYQREGAEFDEESMSRVYKRSTLDSQAIATGRAALDAAEIENYQKSTRSMCRRMSANSLQMQGSMSLPSGLSGLSGRTSLQKQSSLRNVVWDTITEEIASPQGSAKPKCREGSDAVEIENCRTSTRTTSRRLSTNSFPTTGSNDLVTTPAESKNRRPLSLSSSHSLPSGVSGLSGQTSLQKQIPTKNYVGDTIAEEQGISVERSAEPSSEAAEIENCRTSTRKTSRRMSTNSFQTTGSNDSVTKPVKSKRRLTLASTFCFRFPDLE